MTVSTTHKHSRVTWNAETIKAFQDIRQTISQCPLMHFIDNVSPIHLYIDASDYGLGGVKFEMKWNQFHLWASHSTSHNWIGQQSRKKLMLSLCIVQNLVHSCVIASFTDHKNLTYMKSSPSSVVGRWSMAPQELDYTIAYVRGSENTVADAISRLTSQTSLLKFDRKRLVRNPITYQVRSAALLRSYLPAWRTQHVPQ